MAGPSNANKAYQSYRRGERASLGTSTAKPTGVKYTPPVQHPGANATPAQLQNHADAVSGLAGAVGGAVGNVVNAASQVVPAIKGALGIPPAGQGTPHPGIGPAKGR